MVISKSFIIGNIKCQHMILCMRRLAAEHPPRPPWQYSQSATSLEASQINAPLHNNTPLLPFHLFLRSSTFLSRLRRRCPVFRLHVQMKINLSLRVADCGIAFVFRQYQSSYRFSSSRKRGFATKGSRDRKSILKAYRWVLNP